LWSVPYGGARYWKLTSSPTVAGGVVYIANAGGQVLDAFDARTGAKVWSQATTGGVRSAAAVSGGTVYVATNAGDVESFDTASGLRNWDVPLTKNLSLTTPAVASGDVFVAGAYGGGGKVAALNAATGAVLWTANTAAQIASSPAVSAGIVFVGSNDGTLYAYDASSGAQLWKTQVGAAIKSSPAEADNVLFVGSDDGQLRAFNATTGAQLWNVTLGGQIDSSPAVFDGTVYATSTNGSLYAYRIPTS
jgi:outer membrane protein assembly factor BamB